MAEPRFITYDQALRLHHHSIENYGGSHGLRDQGALESALAMPEAGFGGEYMHSSLFDKAAAYLYHIVKNHPFVDGNKRTGFGCANIFLRLNGYQFEEEYKQALEELTLRVASQPISKAEIAQLLEDYSRPV
ncbi:MAG: type II toxin-antitoxin system death-on-curing family toxin [Candidatus Sericytochromatia bacterium]|nr:type II toxin-antitoxin system death-on-curing family toxin [Candidatus Sericytochromatia bacterium]